MKLNSRENECRKFLLFPIILLLGSVLSISFLKVKLNSLFNFLKVWNFNFIGHMAFVFALGFVYSGQCHCGISWPNGSRTADGRVLWCGAVSSQEQFVLSASVKDHVTRLQPHHRHWSQIDCWDFSTTPDCKLHFFFCFIINEQQVLWIQSCWNLKKCRQAWARFGNWCKVIRCINSI